MRFRWPEGNGFHASSPGRGAGLQWALWQPLAYLRSPHATYIHPRRSCGVVLSVGPLLCLGLHPSAVARFVTWRLQGSGTGVDTIQSRDNESRLLNLVQSRVATNLRRCVPPTRAKVGANTHGQDIGARAVMCRNGTEA
jgi:hypothetical protein